MNSGNRNSGYGNSGDRNSGNRNSGNGNSGYGNSGDGNSGHWNSGNGNSGDGNSGYGNSGDRNSGHWNKTNGENGFFNSTESDTVRFFNRPLARTDIKKLNFPSWLYFSLTVWVARDQMTATEKQANPQHITTGGFLRVLDYQSAARQSFDRAPREDQLAVTNLPNYDPEVFREIFGFSVEEVLGEPSLSGKKVSVTVDGRTYTATID